MAEDWRSYQDTVAAIFRELGCDVTVEATVRGVRASHDIDVLVRFPVFGLKATWIVECKYWKRRVPKAAILTLSGVVDDVGADRGILVSETGFQGGAKNASRQRNLSLCNISELRGSVSGDLRRVILKRLRDDLDTAKTKFHSLLVYVSKKESGYISGSARLRDGVDLSGFSQLIGEERPGIASVSAIFVPIEQGLKAAEHGGGSMALRWRDKNSMAETRDFTLFAASASEQLRLINELLDRQIEAKGGATSR